MNYFKLGSFLGSLLIHLAAIVFILFFPQFRTQEPITLPSIDVTLLNTDITAVEPNSASSDHRSTHHSATKLEDPSEAELKRMKRKSRKSKITSEQTNFTINKGFLPGGKGIAKGDIRLDTNAFPYMYYLSMLKTRISENWLPPFGSVVAGETKKVIISFWIDRKGQIINVQVESSSGDKLLDQSALRAVIVSNPFPPLPDAYPEASLGVHFGFICEL